jgi:hypothetical protein
MLSVVNFDLNFFFLYFYRINFIHSPFFFLQLLLISLSIEDIEWKNKWNCLQWMTAWSSKKREMKNGKDHIIENCIFSILFSVASKSSIIKSKRYEHLLLQHTIFSFSAYWKSIEIREMQLNHKMIATCGKKDGIRNRKYLSSFNFFKSFSIVLFDSIFTLARLSYEKNLRWFTNYI